MFRAHAEHVKEPSTIKNDVVSAAGRVVPKLIAVLSVDCCRRLFPVRDFFRIQKFLRAILVQIDGTFPFTFDRGRVV